MNSSDQRSLCDLNLFIQFVLPSPASYLDSLLISLSEATPDGALLHSVVCGVSSHSYSWMNVSLHWKELINNKWRCLNRVQLLRKLKWLTILFQFRHPCLLGVMKHTDLSKPKANRQRLKRTESSPCIVVNYVRKLCFLLLHYSWLHSLSSGHYLRLHRATLSTESLPFLEFCVSQLPCI